MMRRAQADINIRQTNAKQADPRPHHVLLVETADAVKGLAAQRRLGFGIQKTAGQMPEGMAAKSVKREE